MEGAKHVYEEESFFMKEKNLKILWVSAQHTFEIAFASGAQRNGEKKNEDAFEVLASFSVNKLLMDSFVYCIDIAMELTA